jgi:hypothetical protein
MDEKDYIGKRGETVFAFLIGKRCNGEFWFVEDFIDGKAETKDFIVYLVRPSLGEATFFVQVKATTQGYSGKRTNRKLKVKVTREDVAKLKRIRGPAYVAGVDIDLEVGFLLAITDKTPDKQISGIPCVHAIDCTLIPDLWKEVDGYWATRKMLPKASLFS